MPRKHARLHRPRQTQDGPATTLRVIGGRLRGRQFQYTGEARTRPMKQRVREAVFNLVGPKVAGTHVIDLFAGTGALTWEALSRGALSATLIERHFPTARLIEQNAKVLELADRIELISGDTFIWAKHSNRPDRLPTERWLVFCSPPYDLYVARQADMIQLIHTMVALAPDGSLIVVESDKRFDASELPDADQWDVRAYPPAVVAIVRVVR